MKPKLLAIGLIMAISPLLIAQEKPKDWVAIADQPLHFNTLTHDFGTLNENDKTEFKFEFSNDTSAVLVIKHVTASCGCTTPVYAKRPIKANHKGSITVKYDSSRLGTFSKTVLIYTNYSLNPVELRITGKINPKIDRSKAKTGAIVKDPAEMNTTLPK